MKKRVLFLGMILSVVNIANAETGMTGEIEERFEKNEAYVKAIRDKSMEVIKLANSNLEVGKVNNRNIIAVNKETEANTGDIVAINEKMSIHQAESDIAIKQLKEQDEAIFKIVGKTRDGNEEGERVNKIDENNKEIIKNDIRITTLEGQTKSVETNEANITKNKAKTEVNETNIAANTEKIEYNSRGISNNSQRIGSLEGKVDGLETEMKKGFAMSAAMSSIDFQVLDVGDAGFGFGVGNYKNSDAVSLGVGVRPTENMTLNVKGAMSTGKGQETMVGGGAVYKFNLFGS